MGPNHAVTSRRLYDEDDALVVCLIRVHYFARDNEPDGIGVSETSPSDGLWLVPGSFDNEGIG